VVVRHRLRHNGELRRRIKGMSIRPRNCQEFDCVCHRCTIIQRLRLHIVRSHADAMCLMQHLDFVVVVVLSICRHFFHFCIYRWLSRAPGCKALTKHCYSGYAWNFETSCLMNVSFFCIFVYTVLEQLGIGGSSQVVAVIG
jgi:hypothetical protein